MPLATRGAGRLASRLLLVFAVVSATPGGFSALAASKATPDANRAQEFVRQGLTEAVEIFQSEGLSRDEVAERLRQSLRARFDMGTIAGFALGVHRRRISRAEYGVYIKVFEELLVESLTNRIFSLGPQLAAEQGDLVKVTGTIAVGSRDLMVRSQINRKDAERMSIDWRLRERDGSPKIIDVVILGISQAQLYRQEFSAVIQQRGTGVAGLIEALKEKNKQLRHE